jgi:DNA-binding Xre family transcriptional regulator
MSLKNNNLLDPTLNPKLSLIITNIKRFILSDKKIIFDKDVAKCLNIPSLTFASMKKRNSIPYQEILKWCYQMDINPFDILYKDFLK